MQLFEDAERDGSRNGSSAAPPRLLYLDTVAAPPQADRGAPPRPPAATLRTTVQTLWRIGAGQLNVKSANVRGLLRLEGDRQAFISNMAHLRPAFHALTYAERGTGGATCPRFSFYFFFKWFESAESAM